VQSFERLSEQEAGDVERGIEYEWRPDQRDREDARAGGRVRLDIGEALAPRRRRQKSGLDGAIATLGKPRQEKKPERGQINRWWVGYGLLARSASDESIALFASRRRLTG